ncbi:7-deoxyloganetic acid glucosyltransferase [Cajanus cajan]|uniref:Cytokinin-O-glucosyltransferase 2 n=1 Tax=Cajanus cajan TaxID=3821 RepID=A0A151R0X6_CAJCA|nr:7-deoxyloganetic acid glucosyltransferase [Cajanus cajan]KYP36186.1 Cytokinin-O-glucosyltransferase 2 [Cajanus cajan]
MEKSTRPHILVLPFPAEGHIKPMFNLAKLLSHRGHRITFVNTHHNHNRLLQFTDLPSFHTQFPHFHFASITDGVPVDLPPNEFELLISPSSRSQVAKEFRDLLWGFVEKPRRWDPPCCIIADGIMSTVSMNVAQELGVPVITFRTYSATATWVSIHVSKIIQEGLMDLQHPEDLDKVLTSIPGLENSLRECDLPPILKLKPGSLFIDFYIKETLTMTQASGLILNTFDQLEAPIITKLTTIFPKVYTIGPLHTLTKTQITNNNSSTLHLRKEDRRCITSLDHQKAKSVLYVSFGTLVKLSHEQLLEFWHGLVNSLKPFLWVIRHDLIIGKGDLGNNVPMELELGTKERGLMVDWAPQEKVLAHPSVGGFLTHSGWNSTLECITEGVPMLCWPLIAEQTINSRCVSEQWGIGLNMNGTCDRLIVEKMVKNLMENRIRFENSANEMSKKARESVQETGSSFHNLENLIKDIRSMKVMR